MSARNVKKFGSLTGETPQEMHARLAWRGRKCKFCGGPPAIRVKVLTPVKEINPGILVALAKASPLGEGRLPVIPTVHGDMLKTADVFACKHHAKGLEEEAAKGPSFCLVEIDRGPNPTNKVTVGMA